MTRQIVLDTETTGLEPAQGHRVVEIGCVEMLDRRLTGRRFHRYINPGRPVDEGAVEVHGLTDAFLADKPAFAQVADEFLAFVRGAELIIHNAPFDLAFLDAELALLGEDRGCMADHCTHTDTLVLARARHPGQRNSLDALCKRYFVDNSQRELHGALLDAEILADVYLSMTGGQTALELGGDAQTLVDGGTPEAQIRRLPAGRPRMRVVTANAEEVAAHQQRLQEIAKASGGKCLWQE
ncbi:MAG TPA: DNA polymerase III subunit epsilon [Pseudomonadales bacterium]|nr:DNA polymerase III subunit epsilon [Pseudomonadales bacterium]HNC70153.1 DNA polymerase III subunit epsilon [Pseudomonadales bacterium]HND14427.1 DNA polymerase III subunit epsilon [Pseudomonadales bacterium]